MDAFLIDCGKQAPEHKYKKTIAHALKNDIINTTEHTYMMKYYDKPSLVNSSCYFKLEKLLNIDDDCNDRINYIRNHDGVIKNVTSNKSFNYTKEQIKAIKKIIKFIIDDSLSMFGFYGYAGSGKTTTIIELATSLLKHKYINSIVFTAPTNKALTVLKNKFSSNVRVLYELYYDSDDNIIYDDMIEALYKKNVCIEFMTIHKLLKYEIDMDNDGDVLFVRSGGKSFMNNFEIVVIDECSMIPMKIIEQIINESTSSTNSKIIFCGDPAQLPPVSELESVIFCTYLDNLTIEQYVKHLELPINNNDCIPYGNKYKAFIDTIQAIPKITMKQVMRSILPSVTDVCYQLRLWATGETETPDLYQYRNSKEVQFYQYDSKYSKTKSEWFDKCLESNKKNHNTIILTWTNKQADEYNQTIRHHVLNTNKPEKFMNGDILIMSDFYNTDSKIYTSEQIEVVAVEQKQLDLPHFTKFKQVTKANQMYATKYNTMIEKIHDTVNMSYTCWALTVKKIDMNDKFDIYVIHEKNQKQLICDREYISLCIKKLHQKIKSDTLIKSLWKEWRKRFIDSFANVTYGYAITCHKAQGSNYYNVFVDVDDIGKNIQAHETKKCLYTAASRTINELHMLLSSIE